jgi:hypothetical protein
MIAAFDMIVGSALTGALITLQAGRTAFSTIAPGRRRVSTPRRTCVGAVRSRACP